MDDLSVATQSHRPTATEAWWSGTLRSLQAQHTNNIVERLSFCLIDTHLTNHREQLDAWAWEIDILRKALFGMPDHWRLILEFPLLRLGRRLDAVLVTDRAILVIEFKALSSGFTASAREQVEDYALDLRDFHAGSRNQVIIPILVAGTGKPIVPQFSFPWPGVATVYEALPDTLPSLLQDIIVAIPMGKIDIEEWERAPYRPVPTIIEAARMLYAKHGVTEIKTARSDTSNLTITTKAILQAIVDAKANNSHIIVFVTGIPGAGKTLCGLDAVFSADMDATFLTGTLPMVYVLKAALAEDAARSSDRSQRQATREAKSKIQSITGFLRHYLDSDQELPEHVIVFDEAQRAWDAEYGARKFGHQNSEASIVLDIMRRHTDFAVIVALVGNGQEINTGEAGLGEWGRALAMQPDWQIRAAPGVLTATEPRQRLFQTPPPRIRIDKALHLDVPIRNVIRSVSLTDACPKTCSD